jgi:hypothetical protein
MFIEHNYIVQSVAWLLIINVSLCKTLTPIQLAYKHIESPLGFEIQLMPSYIYPLINVYTY